MGKNTQSRKAPISFGQTFVISSTPEINLIRGVLKSSFLHNLVRSMKEGLRLLLILKQACLPECQKAQCAFKDSMIHWILQFTLLIAFRCVLHRCESQEIRCWKLFLFYNKIKSSDKIKIIGKGQTGTPLSLPYREREKRNPTAKARKPCRCGYGF